MLCEITVRHAGGSFEQNEKEELKPFPRRNDRHFAATLLNALRRLSAYGYAQIQSRPRRSARFPF